MPADKVLRRERYSADVWQRVYGLHSQAVAWQGLREMAAVWDSTGQRALAWKARRVAAKLGAGLRRAAQRSSRRMGRISSLDAAMRPPASFAALLGRCALDPQQRWYSIRPPPA